MSLPNSIDNYLRRWIQSQREPFCMSLASDNTLLETWGNPENFGLESLNVGASVTPFLPLIADYDADESLELPFVTDTKGYSYHVHLIPDSGTRFVLLIDAKTELEERRTYQQTANEVKLVLERERRLIADLVDAQAELALRRKEAEQESRRRGEYIATMSHEFRTPVTAILAHAERLADRDISNDNPDIAQAIARVAHRQIWVIDNLLARARLDAEGFAVHASVTDVRRLVDELSLVFAPLAADKGLSFAATVALSVPEFVWVDGLHLRQVMVNLLGNAVKYTSDGSVGLEISHRDDRLSVIVSDTGPGIDEESQNGLFAPFTRGREAPSAPGAGLGLGISRKLVDSMGGDLTLQSAPQSGTKVRFDIPVDSAGGDLSSTEMGEQISIVVCDDDPDITDLLDIRLTEAGFDVTVVANGDALINTTLETNPTLVIVDLNMPGIDGPSAARRLRESGYLAPILVLSGAARRQDIEYALASGCTEFVRKPPQIGALKRLIQQLALTANANSSEPEPTLEKSKQM